MIDIDPRCEVFIHSMVYDNVTMRAVTENMYNHRYIEDVVINTSCEHIENIKQWVSLVPKGRTIVLQSNSSEEDKDHINCVKSIEEFIEQTGLTDIIFSGSLEFSMYNRFMIIGKT